MSTVQAGRDLRDRPHEYFSTACRHDLHDRCPLTCQWCGARCLCRCHRKVSDITQPERHL